MYAHAYKYTQTSHYSYITAASSALNIDLYIVQVAKHARGKGRKSQEIQRRAQTYSLLHPQLEVPVDVLSLPKSEWQQYPPTLPLGCVDATTIVGLQVASHLVCPEAISTVPP